ncbi:MAG: response regulator transcription factor [Solirubrobacteraceae bacterium]
MSAPLPGAALAAGPGSPEQVTILCVEADATFGGELVEQLRADGYRTAHARSAEHARVLARASPMQAVLLGSLDGPRAMLDLLEEIRASNPLSADATWDASLPLIVLDPGATQLDLLRAFEAGADDFIASEHHPYLELRARLKALLRRAQMPHLACMSVGPLRVDTSAHTVHVSGMTVELGRLEYELLVHLARNPTAVCAKQELLRAIWRERCLSGTRTVDSHACRLRRKLRAAGAPGFVVNVWGVGYRLL